MEDIEQIGTSFALETNRRDEDADMWAIFVSNSIITAGLTLYFFKSFFAYFRLKYVEEELAKRKGIQTEEEQTVEKYANPLSL